MPHDDISQLFMYSHINPVIPQRPLGIQLEQQIPHTFRVNSEFIILIVTVLQLRVLGPP